MGRARARVDLSPWETAFDESIPLGSFEEADLEVFLNGESIGRIELP